MLCHLFHLLFKAECDMQTTHCLVYSVCNTVRLYMYKLSDVKRVINQCTITNLANQSGDTNTVTWLHLKCSEHLACIGVRLRHDTT